MEHATFSPQALSGHTDSVRSVAISKDGKTAASGSSKNQINIWDIPTNRLIRTLPNTHEILFDKEPVLAIAISSDGKTVVSGGYTQIKIWDTRTGSLQGVLMHNTHSVPRQKDYITALTISPDDTTVISGSENTIKIWDLNTGELKYTISPVSAGSWNPMALSCDGQTFTSFSFSSEIKQWDLTTGQLLHSMYFPPELIEDAFCFALSPEGQTLLCGTTDNVLTVWKISTQELLQSFPNDPEPARFQSLAVWAVAISWDEKTIVTGGHDTKVRIRHLELTDELYRLAI